MNADLYTKSVEELMVEGKISLYFQLHFNDETQKSEHSWGAYPLRKMNINGKGETPRAAIIDLYNKLS
jgi:hypothetical protein